MYGGEARRHQQFGIGVVQWDSCMARPVLSTKDADWQERIVVYLLTGQSSGVGRRRVFQAQSTGGDFGSSTSTRGRQNAKRVGVGVVDSRFAGLSELDQARPSGWTQSQQRQYDGQHQR